MSQFGQPSGWRGRVAGAIMARENAGLNRSVVAMLEIEPEDRVIEVGSGPGVGLAAAATQAADGRIVGVDSSEVMVESARRRNRRAVAAGHIELRHAPAEQIPFADDTFTKAFSVNAIQHWSSVAGGLAEIRRVLVPGGQLLLAFRRQREGTGLDPHAGGLSEAEVTSIIRTLGSVGFDDVRWSEQKRSREIVSLLNAR